MSKYTVPQRALHWVTALTVFGVLAGGLTLGALGFQGATEVFGEAGRNFIYKYHKTFGVVVLILMTIRIVVKLMHGRPDYAEPLAPFERIASAAVHGLLYVALLAMPILGWLATGAGGFPVEFFNWVLPPILSRDKDLSETLFALHELVGFLIIALLILHIGGALRHAVIKKDGVLSRML